MVKASGEVRAVGVGMVERRWRRSAVVNNSKPTGCCAIDDLLLVGALNSSRFVSCYSCVIQQ